MPRRATRTIPPFSTTYVGCQLGVWTVQVRAHGDGTARAAAWGAWSATLVATTGPPPRPSRPDVDATALNSVTLSWPMIDGVANFQVQHRSGSGSWTTLPEQRVKTTEAITHDVSSLQSQTTYRFRVRFRGDGSRYVSSVRGNPVRGPWSAEVSATTLAQTATGTISIADLSSKRPQAGQQVTFWVEASDLTPATRYRMKLTVESGDFGFNRDCSDKVELISNMRSRGGTFLRRQMRIRACGVSTSTVVARLIHDPIGGSRSVLHSHEVTVASVAPGAPGLSAGSRPVFVGESVTLTADAQSPGSVAHYQWQQWSAGAWTDLGATTPNATRSVTSNTAAVNFYRVLVVYDFGTTLESPPVAVEWKAIIVGVTSSPEYPRSGAPATSTVTLTAVGDVPSGAEYQWQHTTSSGWTDLGATTTSATQEVTSARRGTRKFRVEVRNAGVPVQSEPVYVTWDEWDIVTDMIGELSEGVASSSDYTNAQTSLLSCMNATSTTSTGSGGGRSVTGPLPATIATFDDLLASYTGDVKDKMEDTGSNGCATESNAMFSTNESEARSALATLKVGNSEYAAWLATPHGRQFEGNLGDPDELKFVSYLGATTFEPGEFTAPLYIPSDDGGRDTRDGPDEEELPVVGTGLDCLPQTVSNGADLTLTNKLVVLNCLVFSTPHEFWVQGGERSRDADRLKDAIDSRFGRFAWLDRGDWVCTKSPDGPLPSCLKHDVAYGGLQEFAGMDVNTGLTAPPDGTELDEAWNPRNKSLADAKFKADISKWGCQDSAWNARLGVCLLTSHAMAEWPYYWGTARFNHKGWPVTARDLRHIEGLDRFVVCREPVVPTVSRLTASLAGSTITATWTLEQGCVPTTLADVSFSVTWFAGSHQLPTITSNISTCTARGNELTCSYEFDLPPGESITEVSIYVVPMDREYGGEHYGAEGKKGRLHRVSVGPYEF